MEVACGNLVRKKRLGHLHGHLALPRLVFLHETSHCLSYGFHSQCYDCVSDSASILIINDHFSQTDEKIQYFAGKPQKNIDARDLRREAGDWRQETGVWSLECGVKVGRRIAGRNAPTP